MFQLSTTTFVTHYALGIHYLTTLKALILLLCLASFTDQLNPTPKIFSITSAKNQNLITLKQKLIAIMSIVPYFIQKIRKPKGVDGLIEVNNPNRNQKAAKKVTDLDTNAEATLSRREREEIEKQQAQQRYQKLHMEGKTEQAQKDLARLAIIRKQREEAARKKEEAKKGISGVQHSKTVTHKRTPYYSVNKSQNILQKASWFKLKIQVKDIVLLES